MSAAGAAAPRTSLLIRNLEPGLKRALQRSADLHGVSVEEEARRRRRRRGGFSPAPSPSSSGRRHSCQRASARPWRCSAARMAGSSSTSRRVGRAARHRTSARPVPRETARHECALGTDAPGSRSARAALGRPAAASRVLHRRGRGGRAALRRGAARRWRAPSAYGACAGKPARAGPGRAHPALRREERTPLRRIPRRAAEGWPPGLGSGCDDRGDGPYLQGGGDRYTQPRRF